MTTTPPTIQPQVYWLPFNDCHQLKLEAKPTLEDWLQYCRYALACACEGRMQRKAQGGKGVRGALDSFDERIARYERWIANAAEIDAAWKQESLPYAPTVIYWTVFLK